MDYKEKYNEWLHSSKIDSATKQELMYMSEEQQREAFGASLKFGTAGIRGILGAGTNRLNIYQIRKITTGFAYYLLKIKEANKSVVIAYDNRHMSYKFAIEAAKTLATYGIKSYIFESLRPTPELSFSVKYLGCIAGIMITASHNPKEYNGYKVYNRDGCQMLPFETLKISDYINSIKNELNLDVFSYEKAEPYITWVGPEIDKAYYKAVQELQFKPRIEKSNFKIVFSPSHGAANIPVRKILEEEGYDIIPVLAQCMPDPDYSNTVSPNPESKDSFILALKKAKEVNADMIIVTDPDGDRFGLAVKHKDEYILLNGNQSAAILLEYILIRKKKKGLIPKNGVVFSTIVSSDLTDYIAKEYGISVERTLTGFKYMANKITEYEKTNEKEFLFGYEESYGCMYKKFVKDKDAVQAALLAAEAGVYFRSYGRTFVDVLNDLYKKHGYFEDSLISIYKEGIDGAQEINNIMSNLREENLEHIGALKVKNIDDYQKRQNSFGEKLDFPVENVLKYYLEDGSWVAVRPSGTEPKCKFYFCVKGEDAQNAEEKTLMLKENILKIIGEK